MSEQVKIKLDGGRYPSRGSLYAAGYDLYAVEEAVVAPYEGTFIGTGVYLSIPRGMHAEIRPRSGLSTKLHLIIPNSPGTVDEDYRGEVKVYLFNLGQEIQVISKGDRIAQMVFTKHEEIEFIEVDKLDETERGDGGFGSTGLS